MCFTLHSSVSIGWEVGSAREAFSGEVMLASQSPTSGSVCGWSRAADGDVNLLA